MELPHQKADIAGEDFQFLEDLATAYWYSEVLFALLELNLCGLLAQGPRSVEDLAGQAGLDRDGLSRLMAALVALGLIVEDKGKFENGPLAARYLVPDRKDYAGNFLRYRRYLIPHWQRLIPRLRQGVMANDRPQDEPREVYHQRVFDYVRALDLQARLKAAEALESIALPEGLHPRWILDLGGGSGAWCRAFLGLWPQARAVLLDLPETLSAARKLYPGALSWQGIDPVAGNALTPCFGQDRFDLVLLSNILHAYSQKEAQQLLQDALTCLAPGGTVLIHDYLLDQHSNSPLKGSLYDLHMMLNTYNGRVYGLEELMGMMETAGLKGWQLMHLRTDTSIILARRDNSWDHPLITPEDRLIARARTLGFKFARLIKTSDIAVEPWVRLKCRFGCARYGSSLTCPPLSLDEAKMKELLSRYTHGLLVQGTPPSKQFHEGLLALERSFFLNGYWEVLSFGAGPCPVCSECPPLDRQCRFPKMARPSLEACGVDVYETAHRAGLNLEPITHHLGYIKYVGLVLFNQERKHAPSVDPGRLHP